jgi:NAD(P)-dependent dehydrogenase (short-subunit alcohol dehydrogenase family)
MDIAPQAPGPPSATPSPPRSSPGKPGTDHARCKSAKLERLLAQSENRVALGRIAQSNDIAPAVLFLASAAAAYITGVVLPVDGGTSASTGQAHLQLRHAS